MWLKHPLKLELKKEKRFKAPLGKDGNAVWSVNCALCLSTVRESDSHVDHIHPAGSLKDLSDIERFVTRLAIVSKDDLRIVCVECHNILTYQERMGISWEEAVKRKREIAEKKVKKGK